MELKKPNELNFEDVAREYIDKFDEYPPMLTTLDENNQKYLGILKKAIEEDTKLTRNDIGKIFMPKAGNPEINY